MALAATRAQAVELVHVFGIVGDDDLAARLVVDAVGPTEVVEERPSLDAEPGL